ncbi:MAG TPA: hypothetical protein PLD46_07865 [Hyphomicrobium sp.]|nr:hypothetical protein [Hyphomicrobium sp.]
MPDFIYAFYDLERFPVVISSVFVLVAYGLIRDVGQSAGLALLAAPILLAGTLSANVLIKMNSINIANDKDTNVVVASAAGMMVTFGVLLFVYWLVSLLSERHTANKKLKPL